MYKNIQIADSPVQATVPARGYYFNLTWVYTDMDGETETHVGPIPASRHDLALELANLLKEMQDMYDGEKDPWDNYERKDPWDNYESAANYGLWFNHNPASMQNQSDQKIRNAVQCKLQYLPCEPGGIAGAIAQLTQFAVQYRDGIIADPYNVILS